MWLPATFFRYYRSKRAHLQVKELAVMIGGMRHCHLLRGFVMVRFAAVFALLILFASQGFAVEHTKDSLTKVQKNLADKKAILLDVRETSEWKQGHLAGAQLFPLSELHTAKDAEKLAKELPKEKIIYCHCAGGVRVIPAAEILKRFGYDVRPMSQGYSTLLRNGFPAAK